jgi:hypothetical protein
LLQHPAVTLPAAAAAAAMHLLARRACSGSSLGQGLPHSGPRGVWPPPGQLASALRHAKLQYCTCMQYSKGSTAR